MTNKKIILITFFLLTLMIIGAPNASALDITSKLTGVGTNAGFGATPNLANTIGLIIKALLSLLGVLFLAYTIYAGYLWMMARGNDEQLTKAKAIIRGSIIGLIIVLAAYAITSFVVSRVNNATGYNPGQTSGSTDANINSGQ